MNYFDFYDIIERDIETLIIEFKENEYLKKQDESGKKSFGFLLWFLKNYVPDKSLSELENFITEGNDDTSCDLIFENTNQLGELIYYIVQAKWFQKKNILKSNQTAKEIKACLTDFRLILSGKKHLFFKNENLNKRYGEFIKHKKLNGKIKFLFVTLCKGEHNIERQIDDFISELVSFEFLDLQVLKKNFVEINIKQIKTHNPIETPYIPQSEFNLEIIPFDFIKIAGNNPHQAYILLVKPREIFKLFEKYRFSLFYKNIRNPLPSSYFNKEIANTIKNNPLYFWYFNNGITAITDSIFPFHEDADNIKVKGIQVINGAQTVYQIYEAYKFAKDSEREKMNEDALITLRILRTGGQDFDLKVCRYTNSQNPINERDFHSNDEIQKRLQNDFLDQTNVLYETRRGEFRIRSNPKSIIISNETFGQTYLAYFLHKPLDAKSRKKLIFYSTVFYPEGFYEKIFNNETNYLEMYISYNIYLFIEKKRWEIKNQIKNIDQSGNLSEDQRTLLNYSFVQYASFDILALFRFVIVMANENNVPSINSKIKTYIETDNSEIFNLYYEYILKKIKLFMLQEKEKDLSLVDSVWFKTKGNYQKLLGYFADQNDNEIQHLKF